MPLVFILVPLTCAPGMNLGRIFIGKQRVESAFSLPVKKAFLASIQFR